MEASAVKIMDEAALCRAVMRISHEIAERNKGVQEVVLAGIKRRGVPLAGMICDNLKKIENTEVPFGTLDISFYRDDLSPAFEKPQVTGCEMPCDITGKKVVLIDDVIYTGRTARAAIEALFEFGRPQQIQLAVLIDRGHRELPIRPDYVGKNIPTSLSEKVTVRLPEFDGDTGVLLLKE